MTEDRAANIIVFGLLFVILAIIGGIVWGIFLRDTNRVSLEDYQSCAREEQVKLLESKEISVKVIGSDNISFCLTKIDFDTYSESYYVSYAIEVFNNDALTGNEKIFIVFPELAETRIIDESVQGKYLSADSYGWRIQDIGETNVLYVRIKVKPVYMQNRNQSTQTHTIPIIITQ